MSAAYPMPWEILAEHFVTPKMRVKGRYKVGRLTAPTDVQFVLEGFSDEPMLYKRHREAQEVVDRLNKEAQSPASGAAE